jgi:hypothetical protein
VTGDIATSSATNTLRCPSLKPRLVLAVRLLQGYRATSHWSTHDLLEIFGAIPTEGRVVQDRNRFRENTP